jgi:hypothetical protein
MRVESLLSEFNGRGLYWSIQYAVNQVAIPVFWRQELSIPPHAFQSDRFQQVRQVFQVDVVNLLLNSKGCCYGVSRSLVQFIRQADEWDPVEVLKAVCGDQISCIAYQIDEIQRASLQLPLSSHSAVVMVVEKPSGDELKRLFMGDQLCIIRYWQKGSRTAHALVLVSKESAAQHWLYDQRWLGAYRFDSSSVLVNALIQHLSAVHPSPFCEYGRLAIEDYLKPSSGEKDDECY